MIVSSPSSSCSKFKFSGDNATWNTESSGSIIFNQMNTNPTSPQYHISVKEINKMFSKPKTSAKQDANRDPILARNVEEFSAKASRTLVPSYIEQVRKQGQKKSGLAKAAFSKYSTESFKLSYDEPEPYKPKRKVIETKPTQEYTSPMTVKKAFCEPARRNPILEGDESEARISPRKSNPSLVSSIPIHHDPTTSHQPERAQLKNYYEKKFSSSVFSAAEEQPVPKPRVLEKPGSAADLLAYNYALPYRESKISTSTGTGLLKSKEPYQQISDNKSAAAVYAARTSQSMVTFI